MRADWLEVEIDCRAPEKEGGDAKQADVALRLRDSLKSATSRICHAKGASDFDRSRNPASFGASRPARDQTSRITEASAC